MVVFLGIHCWIPYVIPMDFTPGKQTLMTTWIHPAEQNYQVDHTDAILTGRLYNFLSVCPGGLKLADVSCFESALCKSTYNDPQTRPLAFGFKDSLHDTTG